MKKHNRALEFIAGLVAFLSIVFLLYITGIGCPIKFATGISCPGCGMTRAWLSALSLQFDLAFAYHPLFWLLPFVLAIVALREHINKRFYTALLLVFVVALLSVWVIRLILPQESNVLCQNMLCEDVVTIGPPGWLNCIHALHI